jgi:hypothetical protein
MILALAAGVGVVASRGNLVAPPLAATDCIDEKLALIREIDLSGVRLIGTGSSAAWRNLSASEFERASGIPAFNAGLCLLHVNQTAFWTDVLLEVSTEAESVLYIVAPRDFEDCTPADTRLFDPVLTALYLRRKVPSWAPYAINFKWHYLITQVGRIQEQRKSSSPNFLSSDESGWSPLRVPKSWMPEPVFDPRCFEALRDFDAQLEARNVRLVVATLPVKPLWRSTFDPDLTIVAEWKARIRSEIRPGSIFIDGTALEWTDARFVDPVHLLPDAGIAYSRFLAGRLNAVLAGRGQSQELRTSNRSL